MKTVCVLLSSYNGELFIKEQIDSILAQEGVHVNLIVRDDGSTDSTLDILEDYSTKGLLSYYTGDNLGWKRSFMDLLISAPNSDYYAFCDQDDHWLPNKLNNAINCIEQLQDGPNLYISNTIYWKDGETQITRKNKPYISTERCLIWCLGPGCTMVFNKQLKELVKNAPPKIETPHDKRIQQVAALFGHIHFDMTPHILYRQHGNNQLGATVTFKGNFKRRIAYYCSFKRENIIETEMSDLLSCYGSILSNDYKAICETLLSYKSNLKSFFKVLFSRNIRHENILSTLGFKFKIIFHLL